MKKQEAMDLLRGAWQLRFGTYLYPAQARFFLEWAVDFLKMSPPKDESSYQCCKCSKKCEKWEE